MQQGIDEYEPCREHPANEKRNVRQKLPRDWLHEREVEAMITAAGRNRRAERAKPAVERTKRSKKSAVIVERLVRVQLRAMGCKCFNLGIKRDAGEMILREGQGRAGRH
jgi:hypothetical protein